MNPKELILGTAEENAAQEIVSRLKGIENPKARQRTQLVEAEKISRGLFLRRLTIGGGLLLVAAGLTLPSVAQPPAADTMKLEQPFNAPGFQNWERYFNNQLPQSSVLSIANDLMKAPEYPGFLESGQLLRAAIVEPGTINQLNPPLAQPLRVSLASISRSGAIAGFNVDTEGTTIAAKVTDRSTGVSTDTVLAEINKHTAELQLEQTMAYGTSAVKALMIAKEISHLAHIPELKQRIYDRFNEKFYLSTASSLAPEDILFDSGMLSMPLSEQSGAGFEYRNMRVLLDWAGYWHITPALGRMLRQGVLNSTDKMALSGNIDAFNIAQGRKLIAEQKPGVYMWRENVGPFSQEWQDVMKSAKQVPILDDPRP